MEIMQELADMEKEARENRQKIEHWQTETITVFNSIKLSASHSPFFFSRSFDAFSLAMVAMKMTKM